MATQVIDSAGLRLGIDTGGTFTDFSVVDARGTILHSLKESTTPENPWIGIERGLRRVGMHYPLDRVNEVVHGTTLVINALIQRTGARIGLITTRGFADVLTLQRENRYDVYDPDIEFPRPLIDASMRREIGGRVSGRGEVLSALDRTEIEEVATDLADAGAEAIAVCLINSYLNGEQEKEVAAIIRHRYPDLAVSLSHEVLPEIREFERFSATAINAYVQPMVTRYLRRFQSGLRDLGCPGRLMIMTSARGMVSAELAAAQPIQITESGPAGGVFVAGLLAESLGLGDCISFDMGGTTAKSCGIVDGDATISRTYEVARVARFKPGSGLPLRTPVVDLLEIGAGGGSIASVSSLGILQVGPRSAAAYPGPACFNRGGQDATVTDADLILGLISTDSFASSGIQLDGEAARDAISTQVAVPLGLSVEQAALAILRVATDAMAESIRVHAAEMNLDLRAMSMVAFGGAGPVHACAIATALGIRTVVCPTQASVFSTLGLLGSPRALELMKSAVANLDELDLVDVRILLNELEARGRQLVGEGSSIMLEAARSVDMCYAGQAFEVSVPIAGGAESPKSRAELRALFDKSYERLYGRSLGALNARCMTWRVRLSGPRPALALDSQHTELVRARREEPRWRDVVWSPTEGRVRAEVLSLDTLAKQKTVDGPALVETGLTTLLVPRGAQARYDERGGVVVDLGTD